MSEVEHDV